MVEREKEDCGRMKDNLIQYLDTEITRLEDEHSRCLLKGLRGSALEISWKLTGLYYALNFIKGYEE